MCFAFDILALRFPHGNDVVCLTQKSWTSAKIHGQSSWSFTSWAASWARVLLTRVSCVSEQTAYLGLRFDDGFARMA